MVLTALLLGHAGIGIADRNTVAGVVRAYARSRSCGGRHVAPKDPGGAARRMHRSRPGATLDLQLSACRAFKLVVGARLVFADGTPDIIAYPAQPPRLGPAHAGC